MPPRSDLILFLDLETTGVDQELDNIIEFGGVMLSTEEGYPEIGAVSIVVQPTPDAYSRLVAKDVVREMHEKNGLLSDLGDMTDVWNIWDVDEYLVKDWIPRFAGTNTSHIPYGGSGVGHFDRRFIRRWMPKFDARITHWAYDVGVLRRMFEKAGVPPYSQDAKTHRALDDARVHANEFRFYNQFIGFHGNEEATYKYSV